MLVQIYVIDKEHFYFQLKTPDHSLGTYDNYDILRFHSIHTRKYSHDNLKKLKTENKIVQKFKNNGTCTPSLQC